MPSPPFFTVILPTYNRAAFLPKAIESVLAQAETDWELIIVDDGSTDHTHAVVHSYTDARIRYVYQNNAERSAARNHGIRLAQGQYLCFLDSDDFYLSHHLTAFKKAIQAGENPVALFFCDILLEDTHERSLFPNPVLSYRNAVEWMVQMPVGALRTCSHREILPRFPFNPHYTVSEDTDVWAQVAQHYPIVYVPAATIVVQHHTGRSVDRGNTRAYQQNLTVKKAILRRDRAWIGRKVQRLVLHNAWFNLAQSHQQNKQLRAMSYALLASFWYGGHLRWKEKLYMLYKEVLFGRGK